MKWKLKNKTHSAYTLIEILIALTIIGLIFGFGYVSFREFSQRQALAGLARGIKGDLRLAQEMALAGQKPTTEANCNSPNVLNGYYFRRNSNTNYTIEPSCSGGAVGASTKSVDLPTGITMSVPSPNPILFKILGEGTNITGSTTITLTQANTGNIRIITITQGGEIK